MATIKEGTKWVFKEDPEITVNNFYRVEGEADENIFILESMPSESLYMTFSLLVVTGGTFQYYAGGGEHVVYYNGEHEFHDKGWVDEAYRTIVFLKDVELDEDYLTGLQSLLESETPPSPPEPPDPPEPPEGIKHEGSISGIGNRITRQNEITADNVAVFRNFCVSYESGIISDSNHDFYATVIDDSNGYGNTIHITDGMCFAYGYFGYSNACDFTFLPPAVEQYHVIYAEMDRSVIPNTCIIKTRNNQSNPNINTNTFRQDVLSLVKTGVYQIPLWKVKATNKGIKVEDLRNEYDLRNKVFYIKNVTYADTAKNCNKEVLSTVVGHTEEEQKLDDTVATTAYVQREVKKEINK